MQDAVRTNKIPRQVPPQPWFIRHTFAVLVGGILPFGAVFIELFFILTSMWLNQVYYIFGVLFIVLAILCVAMQKLRSCCVTSTCARKTTDGSGGRSSRAQARVYTFSYTRRIIFYMNLDIEKTVPSIMYLPL